MPSVKVEIRTVEEIERAGGQDLQTADVDVPPTKLQKDQPQCKRTNQNDGRIHVLHPVRTDHRRKSVTDRLCHGLQSPNDAIQETDNREETAQRTRQVKRGKRRIQQKPGRCRQMEGAPPAKRTRKTTKSATATKATPKGRGKESK